MLRIFSSSPTGFHPQSRLGEALTNAERAVVMDEIRRALAANPPIHFRRNLENLVALAELRGCKVILATFALSEHKMQRRFAGLRPEVEQAIAEQNQQLLEISQSTSAVYFPFASDFPQDARNFGDSVHVNEAGAALKAQRFAEFVLEQNLIPNR